MLKRKIGAHVSTAGGYYKAAERAATIGANCAQIFSSSPRVWNGAWEQKLDLAKYREEIEKYGIEPVFTHALYLVNLASANPVQVEKSVAALKQELGFDSAISGGGVIVHLGSHLGKGWTAVREQVAQAIKAILADTPKNSTFLIENSAGQNGKVCSDLTEIRWLLDQINSSRLGWCVDTCHAFAAGFELGVKKSGVGHQKFSACSGNLVEAISDLNLWETLQCVHVNDSKGDFGSGIDRHENLLEGKIPAEDFQYLLNHPKIKNLPLILEVPGLKGEGPDAENISRLKDLVREN